MSTEDELWRARFNVKRAVLDLVAQEYHEVDTAGEVAMGDYLSDMLDEALKEYAEAYLMEKSGETMEEFKESFKGPKGYDFQIYPKKSPDYFAEALHNFLNRRAD